MSSLVVPMMWSWQRKDMSGTVWLGMACRMICSMGEVGDENRLMPMRREAMEMVRAAVKQARQWLRMGCGRGERSQGIQ